MLAVFKALANTNRINILKAIAHSPAGSLTVNEIAQELNLAQPKISDHLKLMRINRIVRARQNGTKMNYFIKDPIVPKLIKMLE